MSEMRGRSKPLHSLQRRRDIRGPWGPEETPSPLSSGAQEGTIRTTTTVSGLDFISTRKRLCLP